MDLQQSELVDLISPEKLLNELRELKKNDTALAELKYDKLLTICEMIIDKMSSEFSSKNDILSTIKNWDVIYQDENNHAQRLVIMASNIFEVTLFFKEITGLNESHLFCAVMRNK